MSVMKKLLLRILLEDAIANEEAAYAFYESALEHVSQPESIALLKKLMAGELRHRIQLVESS